MSSALAMLGLVALLCVVGFGSLRLYSRRLARRDAVDPQRLRRGIYRGMAASGGLAFVGLLVLGSVTLANNLLANVGVAVTGPLGALSWTPALGGAIAASTVTYLGAFPTARAYRESSISAASAAFALVRYQSVLAVGVLVALALVRVAGDGAAGTAAVLVCFGVALYVASPWFVRLSQRAREPTDRAARLDRLCERAGVSVRRRYLLKGHDSERAFAYVRGAPGLRALFVTDYLLDTFDDDEAAALLAAEAGASRATQQGALVVGILALAALGVYAWVGLAESPLGTVLLLAVLVGIAVLTALTRWLVYRGDARAATRVGREPLARALTAVREKQGSGDRGRLRRWFQATPSLNRRLDRLRAD